MCNECKKGGKYDKPISLEGQKVKWEELIDLNNGGEQYILQDENINAQTEDQTRTFLRIRNIILHIRYSMCTSQMHDYC